MLAGEAVDEFAECQRRCVGGATECRLELLACGLQRHGILVALDICARADDPRDIHAEYARGGLYERRCGGVVLGVLRHAQVASSDEEALADGDLGDAGLCGGGFSPGVTVGDDGGHPLGGLCDAPGDGPLLGEAVGVDAGVEAERQGVVGELLGAVILGRVKALGEGVDDEVDGDPANGGDGHA